MNLLHELTTEYNDDPLPIFDALTEAVKQLNMKGRGGPIKGVKDAAGLFSKNKGLAISAMSKALDSYTKTRQSSLRHTVKLFAKTPYEKRMVKSVVDSLTKNSGYYVWKSSYKSGGKYWELRQKNTGYKHKKGQG